MSKYSGARIVAVRFAMLGAAAVSGAKSSVTSENPFSAAAKIQHCDTPAILYLGTVSAAQIECTAVSGFLLGLRLADICLSPRSHKLTLSVCQITLALLSPVILTLCCLCGTPGFPASHSINTDWISISPDLWPNFGILVAAYSTFLIGICWPTQSFVVLVLIKGS